MNRKFRLALVQMLVSENKTLNLQKARSLVKEAAANGANIVALPYFDGLNVQECFNSPYGTKYFPKYAEEIPKGESVKALSEMAAESKVFLVGGSIPEKVLHVDKESKQQDIKYHNTCCVFDPSGSLLTTYRKMHLFDIDIPGKIKFTESEVLSPGNREGSFQTPWGSVHIGICYDMRFPELALYYTGFGNINLMIYPGAFNMTTGPLHWELLQRARAVDNQVFFAAVSPARDNNADYVAWGHSTIVGPSGEIISKTDEKESIVYGDLDLDELNRVRQSIPTSKQKRFDVYTQVRSA